MVKIAPLEIPHVEKEMRRMLHRAICRFKRGKPLRLLGLSASCTIPAEASFLGIDKPAVRD